jgi:predicted CXXCH cytochrome family protein
MRYKLLLFLFCSIFYPLLAEAKTGIIVTKHNLSVTGPGEIKAIIETRVCVFCHTPHNAFPRTPLWNREIGPQNYETYESTTIVARPQQPDGPSRLCLSCHDGTVAIGAVLRPAEGIAMTRGITPERPSYIGTFLKDDHPVSFSYYESLINPEIRSQLPSELTFYGAGYIHCSTCHEPHDNTYGKFLVMDNRGSGLCLKCHNKDGWITSSHKNSSKVIINPFYGLEWTNWVTVSDYGCESCHKPHSAGKPERLLRYLNEEDNCLVCHNGAVAEKDIQAQFQLSSSHPLAEAQGIHDPKEDPRITTRHVECVDCHNSHASDNTPASPPYVSGRLKKVSGVDKDGNPIYRDVSSGTAANYEYEICFKCHSDFETLLPYIPRVEDEKNKRLKFSVNNASYHPVISLGKNTSVPSLNPASLDAPDYVRNLRESSFIYCYDCHSDDSELSKGPHGSEFRPILMRRYETEIQSGQASQNYALCFRCHNVNSILSDQSFKAHRRHIEDIGASCSICHDAHGVSNNTHLINFDVRYVDAIPSPQFIDNGTFSGSCALICHYDPNNRSITKVHTHENSRYP